jgi:hypothetical protein
MDKFQKASYLVSLLTIIESFDRSGRKRSATLTKEYEGAYDEFVGELDKEHEHRKETE